MDGARALGYHSHPKRRWDTMRNHSSFTLRPSARHGACSVCATWPNSVPSATTKAPRSNHREQPWAKTMKRRAKERSRINSPFSKITHTHTAHMTHTGPRRDKEWLKMADLRLGTKTLLSHLCHNSFQLSLQRFKKILHI